MKLKQIIDALPSLQKLAGQEFALQTLYNVKRLMGKLESELAFYNEQRNKIFRKYCDVAGNQYVPREADMTKLNAEMNELLDTEIECEIKEVVISTDENIKLSYNDLVALKCFVRIEGEE